MGLESPAMERWFERQDELKKLAEEERKKESNEASSSVKAKDKKP